MERYQSDAMTFTYPKIDIARGNMGASSVPATRPGTDNGAMAVGGLSPKVTSPGIMLVSQTVGSQTRLIGARGRRARGLLLLIPPPGQCIVCSAHR